MSKRIPIRAILLAATSLYASTAVAQPAGTPTDIGRVTATGVLQGGDDVNQVKPSGTGTRAQAKAAEHRAINKIIVQPQSEIQKLPDVSIAQALSRLPGISLQSDSGEGRFINIRGLDADLNATTFDGVRILPSNLASPTGGGRAVAYDVLPAALVSGIEISETLRPEDDAEGLGGLVNLLPRTPPADGKPFLNATAALGDETQRGTQILDYGFSAGASFGIQAGHGPFDHPVSGSDFLSNPKPFSIFITDTQHNDFRGVDDYEPSYSNQQMAGAPDKLLNSVDLRHYLYNRRRFARGGELAFDPNDTDHFFIRYALAGYNEHAGKDFLNFKNLDSGFTAGSNTGFLDPADRRGNTFLAPSATASRTSTDSEEETRNQILEAGGRDVLYDRFKIDYHAAYSEGTDKFPFGSGGSFVGINPVSLSYNNQDNANFRYHTTDGTNLLDQNFYQLSNVANSTSSSRDREYSGAFNLTIPFQGLTPDDVFKAGFVIRERDRISQGSNGVQYPILGPDQNPLPNQPLPFLGQYTSGPSLVFYNGNYNIGPSINAGSLNKLLGNQVSVYDPHQFQHDTENVYAGYAQYSGAYAKLSWLGGVRLEQTFGVYRGFLNQDSGLTDPFGNPIIAYSPSSFKTRYTSYFPSLQLKYEISPAMNVRAIYSTALGRPGFNQNSPGVTVSVPNLTISVGNPNLAPEYADAFDIFWEYFSPDGGKISVGGFDKEFNTYIYQTGFSTLNPQAFAPGAIFPTNSKVTVTSYINSGPSRVYGIEGEFTQQFTFLPSPLDGFGVDTNFTYNQSSATIQRDRGDGVVINETLQQPSTSPWNFNASVFYEKGPINIRLAANYVSKNLFSLGSTKAMDIYSQQRFRLDLGTAYQANKNIQFYFDAHNLTDTTLKFTETAAQGRPTQREFYGVDVIGGIRVTY